MRRPRSINREPWVPPYLSVTCVSRGDGQTGCIVSPRHRWGRCDEPLTDVRLQPSIAVGRPASRWTSAKGPGTRQSSACFSFDDQPGTPRTKVRLCGAYRVRRSPCRRPALCPGPRLRLSCRWVATHWRRQGGVNSSGRLCRSPRTPWRRAGHCRGPSTAALPPIRTAWVRATSRIALGWRASDSRCRWGHWSACPPGGSIPRTDAG